MLNLKRDRSNYDKKLLEMEKKIRASFNIIKEEFEDHLDAINENTQEIQLCLQNMDELNEKIEKLNEKIDELFAAVREITCDRNAISLDYDEQRIFFVLYTNDNGFMSFEEIAERAHLDEESARNCMTSMLNKGVKMVRDIVDGKLYFKLNPYFKAKQVKENIVKIDPAIIRQMENRVLGAYF